MISAAPPAKPTAWGGTLVVYFGTHVHTETVARRIAETLRRQGLEVDLRDVGHAREIDPRRHDAVVIGASLHREPHRSEMVDWVAAHHVALGNLPTALFSVAPRHVEDPTFADQAIDAFLDETDLWPARTTAIAEDGAVDRFCDDVAMLAASPLAA